MRLLALIAGAVFVLLAAPAAADELRLMNGDRYSGTVVRLSGGTLTFKTAHGELAIPWSEVSALTVETDIIVRNAQDEEQTIPGGTIDIASTSELSRPAPPVTISGGAGAGLIDTGGNTSVNSLRFDGDLVVRMRDNRYTFGGDVNRAEDRGVPTAQNWTISARYDRFLTSRLFLNASAIFTDDRFRDLDLRSAYGVGIGYQVVDTPPLKIGLDGGVGYVDENFEVAEDDSYTALRETTKVDVVVLADRITLFHHHDGYFGVTGDDNLFINTYNGVRFSLVGGFIATLRYDVDYDRSPAPGLRNVDRTFALTLGYRF